MLDEEEILAEIKSQVQLKCQACNGRARIEKNRGTFSIICCWTLCRQRRTLWCNTVMEHSKIGPAKVLRLLQLWMIGLAPKQICTLMAINRKTLSRIMKKISFKVVQKFYSKPQKIGGEGIVVEIDEFKFGKRKYNRGHRVEGV